MTQEGTKRLVDRAMQGDRLAFEELARDHRPRIEGVVRSRWEAGDQDLEDILQESFVRALQALPRFEWQGEDSFFRWLSGIAVNVAHEHAKRRKLGLVAQVDREPAANSVSQSRAMRRPTSGGQGLGIRPARTAKNCSHTPSDSGTLTFRNCFRP